MKAFILVNLLECDEQKILDEILSYKNVLEAYILFGEWDLIVKVEASNPEEAGTFVMEKIRSIPNVKITSTLIVAR